MLLKKFVKTEGFSIVIAGISHQGVFGKTLQVKGEVDKFFILLVCVERKDRDTVVKLEQERQD